MRKMNSLLSMIIVIASVTLTSCGDSSEKTTEGGLKYKVYREGDGAIPEDGKLMLLNLVAKMNGDSVFIDSEKNGGPITIKKVDSIWAKNTEGLEGLFSALKKGDSVDCTVPAKNFFTKTNRMPSVPPGVDENAIITFNIGVKDVLSEEEYREQQAELFKKKQEEQKKKDAEQVKVDIEIIDKYLADNSIEAEKTESGLRYVVTQAGSGENAAAGQTVKVHYAGKVLNGPYFDTSIKTLAEEQDMYDERREPYAPFEFPLGQGRVIKGWDEGIQLLNKGAKATFYIPSTLAYGPNKMNDKITENSILVFDVEVLEFN